jgi:hypothetical protein
MCGLLYRQLPDGGLPAALPSVPISVMLALWSVRNLLKRRAVSAHKLAEAVLASAVK